MRIPKTECRSPKEMRFEQVRDSSGTDSFDFLSSGVFRISDFGRRLQKSHLSGIRTLCSPSPLPSPSGRGSIIVSAFDNPSRLAWSQRGPLVLPLPEGEGRGEGERALESAGSGSFAISSRI